MSQNIQKEIKDIQNSNYFVNIAKTVLHNVLGDSGDVALNLQHMKVDSALERQDSQKELQEKLKKLEGTES